MLWIQTHRPKSFAEITTHSEIINLLNKYTIKDIPNIIFHGQPGRNKKTILYALINHLYNKYPEPVLKKTEIKIGSQSLVVNYFESDEIIEISPSDYGTRDRHVIQNLVKHIAESRPILSLFGYKEHYMKILVIDRAEDLSKDAQAALRVTMEKYSKHFRLFMMCNELSKLIEPLRSRSVFFRIRGFTEEEIAIIFKEVLIKENHQIAPLVIEEISRNARGDCERGLCVLEWYCFNRNESKTKKQKNDMENFKLDWEVQIAKIVNIIKNKSGPESFLEIRKELYSLLNSSIPGSTILINMVRSLLTCNFERNLELSKYALIYEERIRLGTKELFHLEAFSAAVMNLFL